MRNIIFNVSIGAVLGILLVVFVVIPGREKEEAERQAIRAELAAEAAKQKVVVLEEVEKEVIELNYYEPTEEDIAEETYWDELEMLAQIVEAEAGGEDLTGKRLVVDVVLNRVDSPRFPDTISEVIAQDKQFSSYTNGAFDDAGWHMQQEDYDAVMMEVTGTRLDSEIYYFTAGEYNPSGEPAYQHGNHYFSYLKGGEAID